MNFEAPFYVSEDMKINRPLSSGINQFLGRAKRLETGNLTEGLPSRNRDCSTETWQTGSNPEPDQPYLPFKFKPLR